MDEREDEMEKRADFSMRLGKRLSAMRRKRGLTQETLAEMIGRSQSDVSRYERGVADMYVSVLQEYLEVVCDTADAVTWVILTDAEGGYLSKKDLVRIARSLLEAAEGGGE